MSNLFDPLFQALDDNGDPVSGAKLNFYQTGTSTRKNTYSESTLTTPNANPVVADSEGRFGAIYLLSDGAYKVVYTDAEGNIIETLDPVDARVATTTAATLAGTASTTGLSASSGVLSLAINSLTEDTAPDADNDYVATYDASGAALKKVKPANLVPLPPSHLSGLVVSNNSTDSSHDLDITAGKCRDASDTVNISLSALTKKLDTAFAEGDDAGAMISGDSLPTSGTVHIWAIAKADGTNDICANDHSNEGLSPTLPTGYAYKRRIASLRTDSSANILAFIQTGDVFMYKGPDGLSLSYDSTSLGTTAATATLEIPTGVKFEAIANARMSQGSGTQVLISDPDQDDEAPSSTAVPIATIGTADSGSVTVQVRMMTNTSNAWRVRSAASSTTLKIATLGWIDTRGRND